MTAIAKRSRVRRAFSCWPSRIGLLALVVLGIGWGSGAFADDPGGVSPLLEAMAR